MQLTIDIRESAVDKVMYLLENLKSDIKVIAKSKTLEIETIGVDEDDYLHIISGRKERLNNPQNYGSLSDIDWG